MKAPELTKELKGDLQVLKMRGSLDSKRFYKKNDRDGFPKYFQVSLPAPAAEPFMEMRSARSRPSLSLCRRVLAGRHGGGQSSGLLPFPRSQEGPEENHGGGAAGRRRVQTVSRTVRCRTSGGCVQTVYILNGSTVFSGISFVYSAVAL